MMRKPLTICCLLLAAFAASVALAAVKIDTNIPGVTDTGGAKGVCGTVFGFYNFALMIAGILAFGAIVYGGVKYTFAAGNPSGQSEGKEWVKGAILGLLLLVSAYLILSVINPNLTKCTLPELAKITVTPPAGTMSCAVTYTDVSTGKTCVSRPIADCSECTTAQQCPPSDPACTVSCNGSCALPPAANCIPTSGTDGRCNPAVSCKDSPPLTTALGCVAGKGLGSVTATYNKIHKCDLINSSISCHFGGTGSKDGSHAFDVVRPNPKMTWAQAQAKAGACASSCYCEYRSPFPPYRIVRDPSCTNPLINHVHCNVANVGCE